MRPQARHQLQRHRHLVKKSVRAFSIPTQLLGNEIPESRLVIEFSKKDAPASSVIELSPECLVDRNPSRSDPSAVRLKDVTKAAIVEILINENIMESEQDSILGLKENGEYAHLTSDLRIVGFLKARCQVGNPLAVIHIAPGIYSSLTAAGVEDSHLGQLILSPRLHLSSSRSAPRRSSRHLTPSLLPHLLTVSVPVMKGKPSRN